MGWPVRVLALISGLLLLLATSCNAGQAIGIYYLTQDDATVSSVSTAVQQASYVAGYAERLTWDIVEPAIGSYDWSIPDSFVSLAKSTGKNLTISIQAGYRTPSWVYAAGAQSFSFLWDRSDFGPALGTPTLIPVPWDGTFLAAWISFEQALISRYGNCPTVVQIKATGLNAQTQETSLPNGTTDTANWISIGYTRAKVLNAWEAMMAPLADPREFATMFVATTFPPIDDNGNQIQGMSSDSVLNAEMLAFGDGTYPTEFVAQNNGLSSSFVWQPLVNPPVLGHGVGFQAVGVLGAGLSAALTNAIQANGHYVELYPSDLQSDPQGILMAANTALAAN